MNPKITASVLFLACGVLLSAFSSSALGADAIPCEGSAPIASSSTRTCACEGVTECPYDVDHECLNDRLACRDEACGNLLADEENAVARRCAAVASDRTDVPNLLLIMSDDANWAFSGDVSNAAGDRYSLWSSYYRNFACHGGLQAGQGCVSHSDCFGSGARCLELTHRCTGGSSDGDPCKEDEDCGSGSVCEPCDPSGCVVNPMRTPQLDSLAASGAFFPVAHTSAARCAPSITSVMTGRYGKDLERRGRRVASATLPRLLSDTHCSISIGKTWSGRYTQRDACYDCCCEEAGCCDDVSRCPSSCSPRKCCGDDRAGFHYSIQHDFGISMRNIGRDKQTLEKGACLVREANQNGKAFLAWLLPYMPHSPLNAPHAFGECYRGVGKNGRRRLDGSVDSLPTRARLAQFSWFDCAVGTFIDFLKETPDARFCPGAGEGSPASHECGPCARECDPSIEEPCGEGVPCVDGRCQTDVPCLIDTTVIATINDNGRSIGESKAHFTENGYRNPVILSYGGLGRYDGEALSALPPHVLPQIRGDAMAHAIDFLPTFEDYAGKYEEKSCSDDGLCGGQRGRSLRQLFESPGGAASWRRHLFGHRNLGNTRIQGTAAHYARAAAMVAEGVPGTEGNGACRVDADCAEQGWDAYGLDLCVNGVCTKSCASDQDCAGIGLEKAAVRCLNGSCGTASECKLYHNPKKGVCSPRLYNLALDPDENENLLVAEGSRDAADPLRACYDTQPGSRGEQAYERLTCELVRWCLEDCGKDSLIDCDQCCPFECSECTPRTCSSCPECVKIGVTCWECRRPCAVDSDCADLGTMCDPSAGRCHNCQSQGCSG